MNLREVQKVFEDNDECYSEFDDIENKRSNKPDLHAFLLLDELFPDMTSSISYAGHDEIWLNVGWEAITTISEQHLIELIRCGVMFEDSSFKMFT